MADSGMDPLNVYIAGLPVLYNDQYLHTLFEPFGDIVSAKMMFTSNGVKRTGFVLFEKESSAAAAIRHLNGTLLEGDPIHVRPAVAGRAPRHLALSLAVSQQYKKNTAAPQLQQGITTMTQQAPPPPLYFGNHQVIPQPQQPNVVTVPQVVQQQTQGNGTPYQMVPQIQPQQQQPQQVLGSHQNLAQQPQVNGTSYHVVPQFQQQPPQTFANGFGSQQTLVQQPPGNGTPYHVVNQLPQQLPQQQPQQQQQVLMFAPQQQGPILPQLASQQQQAQPVIIMQQQPHQPPFQ